jgi:hypothetical protein
MDTMQTLKLLVLAPFALAACGGGTSDVGIAPESIDMSFEGVVGWVFASPPPHAARANGASTRSLRVCMVSISRSRFLLGVAPQLK